VTARATSFGARAEEYDRVRPEYSAEALDLAVSRLALGPGADVLDLAAGTGKLTRPLVERFRTVVAVEPDPGMRAVLARATEAFRVLGGRAEEIPLPDDSVDTVFVGQAFHWFDTAVALQEIARVLRPRGGLVLIWNAWTMADPRIPEAARQLIESVIERASAQPVRDRSQWQSDFDASAFEPLRKEEIPVREIEYTGDDLVTLDLSTSPFGVLEADELADVEGELRRLVTATYRVPVETRLLWTRLSG
jgi:ubiquinone/menaquinone biosynthesis C-methylase UbiE